MIDFSILTDTKIGTYMGRTVELWIEMGMKSEVYDALRGDAEAIKKCRDSIARKFEQKTL